MYDKHFFSKEVNPGMLIFVGKVNLSLSRHSVCAKNAELELTVYESVVSITLRQVSLFANLFGFDI